MNSGQRTPAAAAAAAAALCIWFKAFRPVPSDNPFAFSQTLMLCKGNKLTQPDISSPLSAVRHPGQ